MRTLAAAALAAALLCALSTTAHAKGRCGDVATRPWCDNDKDPDTRAGLLLKALTRDEKISLLAGDELTGVAGREGTHTGTSNGVARVGLPTVYFSDGPVGPRQGRSTAMPAPMAVASTFDPAIAERHARVIADEVKKKGNDVVYAPAINILRTPLNGRTFEYFGEDPFLTGKLAAAWTKGVQAEGVIGNVKHYAANNQEGVGLPVPVPGAPIGLAVIGNRLIVDVRVDERALREIYLPGFEAAVKEGGVGSVMCAYPRVNGQYACENQHLLEDVLKREWGFKGFVLTDYLAGKQTGPSLNNGLDLDIFPGVVYTPALVNAALAAGQATESAVDGHVRRILRTLFAFGFFDRDAYADDASRIDTAAHDAAAGEIEAQGMVLLRNEGELLPLDASKLNKVALIGPEIDVLRNGGGSSNIVPLKETTALSAFRARLGDAKLVTDDGSDADRAAEVARGADVAIVVVGDFQSEGADKPCMGLDCGAPLGSPNRDALVAAVAAAQKRTVVILQAGGPVTLPWRDAVPALLSAWFPGQNGGTAMARVVLGDDEPGGRLPATFPVSEDDTPHKVGGPEAYPGVGETVRYKEGIYVGYRWYDKTRRAVAFPFGFGLSYTTFAFSSLRLEPAPASSPDDVVVSAAVTNTGSRRGTAVPQLYVGMPGDDMPVWQLKGFSRVLLDPGKSKRVSFSLDQRAFSYWSEADRWDVRPGCYRIGVGPHSRELPLRGVVGRGSSTCDAALEIPRTSRTCTSKRVITITLPRGTVLRGARVRFSGRTARVTRSGRRLKARVNLRGLRAGRVVVRVTGRRASGTRVVQTRVFRTCAPRRGGG